MAFEDIYKSLRIRQKLMANEVLANVLRGSIDTRAHSGAAGVNTLITEMNSTGTGHAAVTLADGKEGQIKVLKLVTRGGSNNAVVTPANFADGTTITFDAANEVAILYFDGDDWQVAYTNATVA